MTAADGLLLVLLLWLTAQGWAVVLLARWQADLARLVATLAARQHELDEAHVRLGGSLASRVPPPRRTPASQPGVSPQETLPCENDLPS